MIERIDGVGAAARQARAAALDTFLATLTRCLPGGVALLAVGGLGRRECNPYSDLDLVLLHDDVPGVPEVASEIWYPIWDARLGLDHSVRTPDEALSVLQDDPKVALGLLDARHLAGDAGLSERLIQAVAEQWRHGANRFLPRLREATAERHRRHGELAFLLEGDLKESAGGLRDVGVLRGIGYAGVADAMRPAVRAAYTRLLDVRDALHLVAGRRMDRLLAQEGDAVAARLGLADRDALLRRVSTDARTVAHGLDDAWRAVQRWHSGRRSTGTRPVRRPVARDVVEYEGEVVLARTAIGPRPDPSLSLRVAAAAAVHGLPIARATGEWLATYSPPLPQPWPAAARDALFTLLGAGPSLVPTWEACDRYGLVATWLPEWHRLRGTPQHSPVHRFTLDRHLVQAAAEAARFTREVERPDLLLLGTFLHDIGKGLAAEDHAEAGAGVAAGIARRIGLPARDVAVIERLVRLHLLLPHVATRRDLSDPVTITTVATAVGDLGTLELLHALARADAAATGPAAWSQWKGRLVAELVARVRAAMAEGELPSPPAPDPELIAAPLPVVRLDRDRVAVAAADRRGLLAGVAGCLAMHRLDVLSADAATVDGRALVQFVVEPRYGVAPDPAPLVADLRRVAVGDVSVTQRLRVAGYRGSGAPPRVVWHREAATDAVVLELRAADAPGLLYRVTAALDAVGAEVRAARISTLGADAVDAFYLVGSWSDPAEREKVEAAVLAAAA